MSESLPVCELASLDLYYVQKPWRFANDRRGDIDAHFARLQQRMPKLFNGEVLLAHQHNLNDGVLSGECLRTDFASFIAWRDWNFPDPSVRNFFALAALRGSDGAFLTGVMGDHTANAGKVYFPGGTPDPHDLRDNRVDLEASVRRELKEETGLSADDLEIGPGWIGISAGPRIALLKIVHAQEPSARLRDRVLANLAAQAHPELADLRIIRTKADYDRKMPDFMTAFFDHVWAD